MNCIIKWHNDMWQEIKDNALFTVHKTNGKYPTSEWKKDILLAEHSPIRTGHLIIECYDVPSFVIGHLVRHNLGFTPFVATLRKDLYELDFVPDRNTPNDVRFDGNFQSFINISRKRLCYKAAEETVEFWNMVLNKVNEIESELAFSCVPECIYRGGCPERKRPEGKQCRYWDNFCEKHKDENLLDIRNRYKIYNDSFSEK